MPDFYRLLSVEPAAGEEELRKAITRELRMWINRTNNSNIDQRQDAERRVKMLEEAEQVLLDSGRRAQYDHERHGGVNGTSPRSEGGRQQPRPLEDGTDLVREGWQLLFDGHVAAAIKVATRSTEQQPSNADAWALLGQAKFRLGDAEDAIYEYKRAIKLRPGEASFYFDLGAIYECMERWNEARQHYERAAQIDPKTAMYRAAIGTICVKTDQFEEAITILERCVREEPANESYQYALAFAYHAGMLASWWHHEDRYYCISEEQALAARAILEKARALKFDDPELHKQISETGNLVESMFTRQFKGSWLMVCFLGLFWVVPGVLWWWANRRPVYKVNHDLYELVNKGKIGSLAQDLAREHGGIEGAAYYSALPPGLKWAAFALPRFIVWFLILFLSPFTFLFLVYDNYGAKYLLGALGGVAALILFAAVAGSISTPSQQRYSPTPPAIQQPSNGTLPSQQAPQRYQPPQAALSSNQPRQNFVASTQPLIRSNDSDVVTVLKESPNGAYAVASAGSGTIENGSVENFYIVQIPSKRKLLPLNKSTFNGMSRNTYVRAVQFLWSQDSSRLAVYVGRKGSGQLFAYASIGSTFREMAPPNIDASVFHSSDYIQRTSGLRAPLDHYRLDGDWRELKQWETKDRLLVAINGTLYGGLSYTPSVNEAFYNYELQIPIVFDENGRGSIEVVSAKLNAQFDGVPQMPRPADLAPAPIPRSIVTQQMPNYQASPPAANAPQVGERFPATHMRLLTETELSSMPLDMIRYAINEMYARHGADFRDKALKNQFTRLPWYRPDAKKTFDTIDGEFTEIERQNVKLLGEYRSAHRGLTPTIQSPNPPLQESQKFSGSFEEGVRGTAHGTRVVPTRKGRGVAFSRLANSRIEYSLAAGFPTQGTLEWSILVERGYGYAEGKLTPSKPEACIFTTTGPDTWYPGSTWVSVSDDGSVSFSMADSVGGATPLRTLIARQTGFRFGDWHTVGVSYGSGGRIINVDGHIVASDSLALPLGVGGDRNSRSDVPTIGEMQSHFWPKGRHDSGFEGILETFRASAKQRDWKVVNETERR